MRPPDPRSAVAGRSTASRSPPAPRGRCSGRRPDGRRELVARLRDADDDVARACATAVGRTVELLDAEDVDGRISTALREALDATCARYSRPWTPRPDLLGSGGHDRARRGRGRRRRRRPPALRRRRPRPPAGRARAVHRQLPRRQRHRPATSAPRRSRASWSTATVIRRRRPARCATRCAARGGTAPEPIADVKLLAPTAFRRELVRAVTADDYARLAERHPDASSGRRRSCAGPAAGTRSASRSTPSARTDAGAARRGPRASSRAGASATTSRRGAPSTCRSTSRLRVCVDRFPARARRGRPAPGARQPRAARRRRSASSTPTR